MRRYTPLLLTAFIAAFLAVLGTVYLGTFADKTGPNAGKAITVYTTIPAEQAALLAQEYEKSYRVRVNFNTMSAEDLSDRLKKEAKKPGADLVVASRQVLETAAADGVFVPYESEEADSVPDSLKSDNEAWVGIWYDPIVFCVNSDYLATLPRIPSTWKEVAEYPGIRLGMTDFMAADAPQQVMFTLVSEYGEAETFHILSEMHPKVVQYVKYLSTPVRMAGMGEVDLSIAVQSETLRYINQGYPLKIVYPSDGAPYLLTGMGLLNEKSPEARAFMNWLLTDETQLALQRESQFYVPTNQGTLAYKMLAGKNLVLFDKQPEYTPAQRKTFLDRWLKEIRFQ